MALDQTLSIDPEAATACVNSIIQSVDIIAEESKKRVQALEDASAENSNKTVDSLTSALTTLAANFAEIDNNMTTVNDVLIKYVEEMSDIDTTVAPGTFED